MSITAYVGLPGHGKSYGVVENVLMPALEQKRIIFTNIPMKTENVFNKYGTNVVQFEVEDIKNNPNWWTEVFTAGALFVLDEVPKLWPAGLKAANMSEQDRSFLAEHRHMVGDEGKSTEIILVVQNLTMIAAFPRGLVETTYWVVKHIKMGSNKRFRVDVYSGVMAGQTPQLARREREIQGKFNSKVYDLYHSHTKSKNGIAGDEAKLDNRNNMFKGIGIKIGIAAMIFFGIFAVYGLSQVKDMYNPPIENDNQQEIETVSNSGSGSDVRRVKNKKKDLLNQVDEIMFSYSHKKREGGKISKKNIFMLIMGSSQSFVTDSDLMVLGYEVKQISECLFHLTSPDYEKFVMCPRSTKEKTFFDELVKSEHSM